MKYRISYIGSDGSHGMLEIETSESDVIKESFDTLNFSKCVDYTFEVRAATLEKEAVIALEELESVYDINGFNSSDRNECPSSTQHSLVLKIDSSTLLNNSYVDVSNNKDTVISCCSNGEASPHKRWYSPSQPNLSLNEGRCVYEEDSADGNCVELHHPGISEYLGVYCCDTETGEVDDNDRETACVGLYKGTL